MRQISFANQASFEKDERLSGGRNFSTSWNCIMEAVASEAGGAQIQEYDYKITCLRHSPGRRRNFFAGMARRASSRHKAENAGGPV